MRTLFGMILARSVKETGSPDRGWDWLRRFDAQTKEYVQNPALLMEKLNRQEGLITVWELTDMLWQAKRGAPLGYRFATSGTPVIDDSIGLVKGAQHPAEAKAFIEYVGSVEAQELAAREAFRLPARTDLPPPSACRMGAGGAARSRAGRRRLGADRQERPGVDDHLGPHRAQPGGAAPAP